MTTLPTSIADWAVVPNVALTSAVDQAAQYRQVVFALHTWMLAMGATVILSSNGTVASAANNVASVADVVYAIAGTAHTWIAYLLQGEYILIDCTNAAADTTPQTIDMYLSGSVYTGGTTTNRATASVAGTESATNVGRNILSWATPAAGYINYGYSATAGIGWFIVKLTGATGAANTMSLCLVDRPDMTDVLRDNGPRTYLTISSSWTGSPNLTNLISTLTSTRSGGTAGSCFAWITTFANIPSGQFANSLGIVVPLLFAANSSTAINARMFGYSRIFSAIPSTAPWNGRSPTDPVLDPFAWWTLPPFAVLWPKSAGDML